jgi:hypothetical protein
LKIVLIAPLANLPTRGIVCATLVLLAQNKMVQRANLAMWVNLARLKRIPHVFTAPKVFIKAKQEHHTVCLVYQVNFKF